MNTELYFDEKNYKRKIDPSAKYILIGNNIDGFVDFKFFEFDNFESVKEKLFDILTNIECAGEWDIKLYQVAPNYKIKRLYGYYKVPQKGKLIFTHSYMNSPIRQITFGKTNVIIIGADIDYCENWHDESKDFENYDLFIEVIKIKII